MAQELDLSTIFKAVTGTLSQNKEELNKADTYNHDHGNHMVEIFDLIQKSVSKKKSADTSEQLAYASTQLRKKAKSGSAKLYADGLENASKQFIGKQISTDTVGTLIQGVMGMPQVTQQPQGNASGDLLGSLLSGLTSGQQTSSQQQTQDSGNLLGSLLSGFSGAGQTQESQGGNLLGSLLSGLAGDQQTQEKGLDTTDLLSAGLAFYASKQKGGSNMEAIMNALSSASPLGQSSHRTQSGAMVIDTILNLAGSMKK